MSVWKMLSGILAMMVCGQDACAQAAPQHSYVVCTIHEVTGPPDKKQAFVIDDQARSVNGVSGTAVSTFTAEKIVWRDESFETTLDRVAGFVTINTLASGDLFSSGPCARADGPRF